MEHLFRILNDSDRRKLAWLRAHVGDARVADAARRLNTQREPSPGVTVKPYLSAVCRYLGVWPPVSRQVRTDAGSAVADRYLAQMREQLARRVPRGRRAA